MNLITDTWRQLVRRRLWPVALVLVAAVVAVPLTLAKQPETAAPAPVTAAATPAAAVDGYVKLATDTDTAKRRRVLGAEKDPFEPAPLPKAKKKKAAKATAAATATATATATPKPAASSGGGGGSTTTPVVPVATPAPKKTYPLYSLKVRFGKTDGTMTTRTLERLKALPSASSPVLVYMGVADGGKTAVFMVSGDVTAEGDGVCEPTPADCQTLKLHAGETEFITVKDTGTSTDAQYELDVEQIHTHTTTNASAAKASRAQASAAGTKIVAKAAKTTPLRYRYDAGTGTLHRLDAKSYKALLDRSRRASL
jgi:hypothetical protein